MTKEWLVAEAQIEGVKAHETSVSMVKAAPAEVDAGADMVLKVKILCSPESDLRGRIVKIIAQDARVVKEVRLTQFYEMANETDQIVVRAPTKPGSYTWTAVFPVQEKEGILYEEGSAPFSFIVKSLHATSMAVWDVPSPIAFGDKFRIKVGVRCSADCNLTGKKIEIYDHEGAKVATGTLGNLLWPETTALCCAEVELEAPRVEGYYTWEVKFPEPDLEVPHDEPSYPFGFRTARQAEHVVTVEVIDEATKAPIKDAHVLLYPYRGYYTDEGGVAKVGVPKGKYDLYVSKESDHHKTFQMTVEVASDVTVKAELDLLPPPDTG